jgi:hypothetical protein
MDIPLTFCFSQPNVVILEIGSRDIHCVQSSTATVVWFQDETKIGQQGSITRIWAEKGTY